MASSKVSAILVFNPFRVYNELAEYGSLFDQMLGHLAEALTGLIEETQEYGWFVSDINIGNKDWVKPIFTLKF